MRLAAWYSRPVTVLCVLLAATALAASFLPRLELGQGTGGGRESYDVILEHFGIDADEIERSLTRPLEAEFSRLEGVAALRSVSEYGKSRVTVERAPEVESGAFFLALSDAVDRVYGTLPSSVQKPRLVSASGNQSPAFIATLDSASGSLSDLRDWVDREVKPALEKRPGVGEVEVGGGEVKEVHVRVDERRAATLGLGFEALAQALQGQDALLPAGVLTRNQRDQALSLRGRLETLASIAAAPIPLANRGWIPLSAVAEVSYAGREPDSVSRIDGQERVVLLVHAAGTANLIAFSHEMSAVLADLRARGVSSRVILDQGERLNEALWQTIRALLEGLAAVFVVLPFLLPWSRRVLAIALIVPLSLLVTVALLAALGQTVDRFVLAGFAVALGSVLDYALLICRADQAALDDLLPSLATALGTTLLFLVPLAFLDFVWPGIRTLVLAVALLLVTAFVFSVLFLPVLRGDVKVPPVRVLVALRSRVGQRLARPSRRLVARLVLWSSSHPVPVLAASIGLVATALVVVAFSGVDLGSSASATELAAHVEFESEASLASVDARTSQLVDQARTLAGVTGVQALARPGSAELTVTWDKSRTTSGQLSVALIELGRTIPGAFVYLPEGSGRRTTSVQVTLSGDDNGRLRELAKDAARALAASGLEQVVLNFKDPPRRLAVRFDHGKVARSGLTVADAASSLRWNLYGPVAVKWVDKGREIDLRVRGQSGRGVTREGLMNLPLVGATGTVRLSAVADLVEETGGAKIYHENRQRVIYLTVQTSLSSAGAITQTLRAALAHVAWPQGYTFRIDPHLAEQEANFGLVFAALLLSLVLIALLLAARSQSFTVPPLTLALVPVALALPLLATAAQGRGFTVPVLLGLVLLGGTLVNNAILLVDSAATLVGRGWPTRTLALRAVRRRLGPLVMTNATAMLGALPLVLAGEQGGILPTLANLVVWGGLGAMLSTLTTIPALISLFPRALRPLAIPSLSEVPV